MKKIIKIAALAMALALTIGVFAACGGNSSSSSAGGSDSAAAADSVKGETQTWGNITVLVPKGMTLTGGNILNDKDPDIVNIAKKDNALNYFLITIKDNEEDVKGGIESTRSINDGCKDVTIDAGASYTGVCYEYSGMDVFHVYGKVDGRIAIVQCYGFAPDSDTTKAVLSSLKVTKSAE